MFEPDHVIEGQVFDLDEPIILHGGRHPFAPREILRNCVIMARGTAVLVENDGYSDYGRVIFRASGVEITGNYVEAHLGEGETI